MRRMCRDAIDLCDETELSSDDQIPWLASSAAGPFVRDVELAVEGRDAPWPDVLVGSLSRAIVRRACTSPEHN
jgi:hypothetical protein